MNGKTSDVGGAGPTPPSRQAGGPQKATSKGHDYIELQSPDLSSKVPTQNLSPGGAIKFKALPQTGQPEGLLARILNLIMRFFMPKESLEEAKQKVEKKLPHQELQKTVEELNKYYPTLSIQLRGETFADRRQNLLSDLEKEGPEVERTETERKERTQELQKALEDAQSGKQGAKDVATAKRELAEFLNRSLHLIGAYVAFHEAKSAAELGIMSAKMKDPDFLESVKKLMKLNYEQQLGPNIQANYSSGLSEEKAAQLKQDFEKTMKAMTGGPISLGSVHAEVISKMFS